MPARLGTICTICTVALGAAPAMPQTPDVRQRAEIPAEFRWDFSAIFPSWQAWEQGLAAMKAKQDAFVTLQGTLKDGPEALLRALQGFDEIGKLQYLEYRYAQLQRDVDTRDQAIAARMQQVRASFAQFDAATAWFDPELLALPEATVRDWFDRTPALAAYRFPVLDKFRRRAHTLGEKGERLLALAGPIGRAPREIYLDLSTSDIDFPKVRTSEGREVTLTPANYGALLQTAASQSDRGQAAAAHVGAYGANANTYAAIYHAVLQRDWFLAQARQFPTTLDAALDADAIPPRVVQTLVDTARAGTAALQRYVRLRQRLLGLDRYHLYDALVPLMRSSATYPYPKALEMVLESVAPLGADYVTQYRRFVGGGRVDVYESAGKKSGAYSAGVYGVGPYLLLNYNDTLDSVFTLAHEGGHAMHTVLSYQHQPFATADYTIFVAEVASTTNERFLLEHLLRRTADAKERFLLLQRAADEIVGTFYTQVMFADFELRAHRLVEQGQPVTTEVLNKLYLDLMREYFGDALTIDEFYQWTWARIPHFFNTPYYVYQYATCFASSAQLFRAMTTGSEASRAGATARYLALLSSGGNDHPMTQLLEAGVDLTQRATVQAVVDQLDELVTRMEVEAAQMR